MRARRACLFVGLSVWLLALPAQADPVAMRLPGDHRQIAVEVGWRDATVAWWFRQDLGIAVDVGLRGEAVGFSFGGRYALISGPRGWGVDAFLSGGFRILTVEPGLSLTATPAIAAGSRGDVLATVGLALPMAARLGSKQARLPLLLELRLGGQPGPVSFGVRGALGPVIAPGGPLAVALHWSAWFAVELPSRTR